MEKFYIVPEKSRLGKDYVAFEANLKATNEIVKQVCDEFDIESDSYTLHDTFKIIPTKKDLRKFSDSLTQQRFDNGLRQFRKSSDVSKKLFGLISKNGGNAIQKPYVPFYFESSSKTRSRLFREGEFIYCSFESESFEENEELQEITPNEFYEALNK